MPYPRPRSRTLSESPPRGLSGRHYTYGPQVFPSSSYRSSTQRSSYNNRSSNHHSPGSSSYTVSSRSRPTVRFDSRSSRPSDTRYYSDTIPSSSTRRARHHDDSSSRRHTGSYSHNRDIDLFDLIRETLPRDSASRNSRRATHGSPTPTLSSGHRSRSRSSFGRLSNTSDLLQGIGQSFSSGARTRRNSSSIGYESSGRRYGQSRSREYDLDHDHEYSPNGHRRGGRNDRWERDSFRYPPQYSRRSSRRSHRYE